MTQYRAAATEMTSLRDELRDGLPGVLSATAENVAQVADKSAAPLTALVALVDCFEQFASGGDDCAALTKNSLDRQQRPRLRGLIPYPVRQSLELGSLGVAGRGTTPRRGNACLNVGRHVHVRL